MPEYKLDQKNEEELQVIEPTSTKMEFKHFIFKERPASEVNVDEIKKRMMVINKDKKKDKEPIPWYVIIEDSNICYY
jgi:hypothetical protein